MSATTASQRYGTDLGQLNPECTATRHGTAPAYAKGCRCEHAREAHRIYQKRMREGRAEKRLVDGCGTRRRIQALWVIGHNSQTISIATDRSYSPEHITMLPKRSQVMIPTHEAIAAAYRLLIDQQGTSRRTRSRAIAAGYVSPMCWGADIDDPQAAPDSEEPAPAGLDEIDEVAVEAALAGQRVSLTDLELVAVVQAGVARGEALSDLAARLHLNYAGAKRMLGGELTPRREKQARIEAEILRIGDRQGDYVIAASLGVQRSTVSRARERLATGAGVGDVTTPDPDAVQVLAQVVHRVWCLPGSTPYARYSQRHRDTDARLAGLVITGMAEAGYAVTSKENQ